MSYFHTRGVGHLGPRSMKQAPGSLLERALRVFVTSTDRDVAGGELGVGLVSAALPVWTSNCRGIKVVQ